MADVTQTAANFRINASGARQKTVQAGETVEPGEPLYLNADGKYWKAAATSATLAAAKGVCGSYGDADDYIQLIEEGELDMGGTLVLGEGYLVSNTSGNIMPLGDLSTGEYGHLLGWASSASNLKLVNQNTTTFLTGSTARA
jgi:hypothetical protein